LSHFWIFGKPPPAIFRSLLTAGAPPEFRLHCVQACNSAHLERETLIGLINSIHAVNDAWSLIWIFLTVPIPDGDG